MARILGYILSSYGGFVGTCEHIKLNIYSRRGLKLQEKTVKRLMRWNKSTEYGRLHNFDKVKSIEDYQKIVPLSTYADYDEYVWRMAEGERGLITNLPVRRFTESSGRVSALAFSDLLLERPDKNISNIPTAPKIINPFGLLIKSIYFFRELFIYYFNLSCFSKRA